VITISPASQGDVEFLAELMAEMDQFYGAVRTDSLQERSRPITEALFGSPPAASVLLARDGAMLAGFASYSFLWPAVGLTRSLYLKELYVGRAHRRQGAGQLLMNEVTAVAARHGCSRLEWTTDTDNAGAQDFYAELRVPVRKTKLFYRKTLSPGAPPI
jgi:GNAT superfamily N-acetyltransferase